MPKPAAAGSAGVVTMIAALYVQRDGVYYGLPDVVVCSHGIQEHRGSSGVSKNTSQGSKRTESLVANSTSRCCRGKIFGVAQSQSGEICRTKKKMAGCKSSTTQRETASLERKNWLCKKPQKIGSEQKRLAPRSWPNAGSIRRHVGITKWLLRDMQNKKSTDEEREASLCRSRSQDRSYSRVVMFPMQFIIGVCR